MGIDHSWGRLAALPALLSLFLSGCASAPPETSSQSIKTKGYVVLHILVNTDAIGMGAVAINQIELQSTARASDCATENLRTIEDKGCYPLRYVAFNTFAGWVPAGTYQVSDAVALAAAGDLAVHADTALGTTFTIVAGHAYDLKTLIYQPTGDGKGIFIPVDQSADPASVIRAQEAAVSDNLLGAGITAVDLKSVFPLRAGDSSRGSTRLGFLPDLLTELGDSMTHTGAQARWAQAKDADDLLKLAKSSSEVVLASHVAPDGSVIAASTLGQIWERDTSGRWIYVDTGQLDSVTDVAKDGTVLLAGIAKGGMLYSLDGGARWQPIAMPPGSGAVMRIFPVGAQKYLLVTQGDEGLSQLGVYSLVGLANPAVTLVKEIPLGFTGGRVPGSDYVMVQGRLLIGKDSKHLEVYDADGGVWTEQVLPAEFAQMTSDDAGQVVTLMHANGIFGSDFYSLDHGDHWQQTSIPNSVFTAHFIAADDAVGLDIDHNALTVATRIITTTMTNGAMHWVRTQPMQDLCDRLIVIDSPRTYICTLLTGAIVSSKDGAAWTVERAEK